MVSRFRRKYDFWYYMDMFAKQKLEWAPWPHIYSFYCLIFIYYMILFIIIVSLFKFIKIISKLRKSNLVMCNMTLNKTWQSSSYCFLSLILAYNYFTSFTICSTLVQYWREHWLLVHVTNMLIPLFEISTIIFSFVFPFTL